MNIAKSKFQQIVQEELQRLIYEQTGYGSQGDQQKERAKRAAPRFEDLKSPKPRPFVKAWLALKEQDPERFAKEVQDLTPEDRADVEFFEKEEEAAQESAPVTSAYRPEAGTSPEADAAFGRAGKRARAKARSAQTKPGAEQERIAGKEEKTIGGPGTGSEADLDADIAYIAKEQAQYDAQQAALGAPGSGTGLGGQPAGTPTGIAPPTYQQGKAATAGQTAAMAGGGSIGGGLTMKSAGGSLVPSLTDPEFTKSSAKFAQGMDHKLGAPKQPLGSKMDSLTKASGEDFTKKQRKAIARALEEHKLQNLNKLEQIIKETIKETTYNK